MVHDPCQQCEHGRSAHWFYLVPGDVEPWMWCDKCGGRCEFVAAPVPAGPSAEELLARCPSRLAYREEMFWDDEPAQPEPLTTSEIIARAVQAMCDMGFGPLVLANQTRTEVA